MPAHIRMIVKHAAIGFGISGVFTAMILYFNIGNLWHLVTNTAGGPIAVIMLVVFGGITFGSVQIGYVIMTMKAADDEPKGGKGGKGDGVVVVDAVPVPVRAGH
jgi:hypothetical protein